MLTSSRKARDDRRAFVNAVVDLTTEPNAEVERSQLPMGKELQEHLQSMESMVMVYHQPSERPGRSDHIYVVLRTAADADRLLEEWCLYEDDYFLKRFYNFQRRPNFLNGDIPLLEREVGYIQWNTGFGGSKKLARFRGPGFENSSRSESDPLTPLQSLEEKLISLEEMIGTQMCRRVDFEHSLDALPSERDKAADQSAELMAIIDRCKVTLRG